MIRTLFLFCGFVLSLATAAGAQASLPDRALVAEGEGRWSEALSLYSTFLAQQPGRVDLWVRVADIHAHLGRPSDAAQALRHAVDAHPDEPSLQYRLSQAHAAAGEPSAALIAIRAALAMRPDDVEYIRSAAILSTWSTDYPAAQRHYRRLYALNHDVEALLQLGRVSAWRGDTAAASSALREYLDARPESPEGWLDLARVEAWRGNAQGALDALERHRARLGQSRAYQSTLARVLVAAGRPNRAIGVLGPLLEKDTAYDLLVSHALAQALRGNPRAARDSLASLRRLDPTNPETRQTHHVVRAALGSRIEPKVSVYTDSDHLQIAHLTASGSFLLPTATRISAGYEFSEFQAPAENGLGRSGGGTGSRETRWGGLAQTFGQTTLIGQLGDTRALDHRLLEYSVGARVRASDAVSIHVERGRRLLAVSPRTLQLGLTQREDRLQLLWTPTLKWHLVTEGTFQRISDGNQRWTATVAPLYGLVRTGPLNLDIGASAYQLHTALDQPNGYYDPRAYESYAATLHSYFKVSDDIGVSASLAAGPQRERARPFRVGANAAVEATAGIYQAWMLTAGVSATVNQRLASGAYRGLQGSLTLARRF